MNTTLQTPWPTAPEASTEKLDPRPEQYTWWSNRGQAWAKNVGWRLDYHLATPGIAALARKEAIYLDQRFSDHAPLTIDYDFTL